MYKAVVGGLVALFLGALPVFSATIDVGDQVLFPDMPGQTIQIRVTPGDPAEEIAGMDLFAQIADGGPDLGVPGSHIDGPVFADADMEAGTIFQPTPIVAPPSILTGGQIIVGGVILQEEGAVVPADGLLVTLTVDTTGFFADDPNNPWDLKLTDTLDAPTTLLDGGEIPLPIPLTIFNGTITLVPEPSTIAMLLGLAGILLAVVARRRK